MTSRNFEQSLFHLLQSPRILALRLDCCHKLYVPSVEDSDIMYGRSLINTIFIHTSIDNTVKLGYNELFGLRSIFVCYSRDIVIIK